MIGLYIVVQPENAAELIRQPIALVLLALSLTRILDGFRRRERPVAPWDTLRGVGTTFALLALLTPMTGDIPVDGARQLLAVGLIVFGVLGILGWAWPRAIIVLLTYTSIPWSRTRGHVTPLTGQ